MVTDAESPMSPIIKGSMRVAIMVAIRFMKRLL